MKMKRWISIFCIITMLLPTFDITVLAEEQVDDTIIETNIVSSIQDIVETEAELSEESVVETTIDTEIPEDTLETIEETETDVSSKKVYYTNPLYEDLEFDLTFDEDASDVQMDLASPEYLTDEKQVIKNICYAMVNRIDTYVVCYESNVALDDGFFDQWINSAMEITDNPKEGDYIRFHLGGAGANILEQHLSNGLKRYKITIHFTFLSNAEHENSVDREVHMLLERLQITENMTDARKVKLIYDYICENVTYDYAHLNDENYLLMYTAYAALLNKTAVCQGYANLFYRLAKEVGLDVRIIRGVSQGEAHSWNIVKLDGKYYCLDATWDAGMENYKYFLKGSNNFVDHNSDAEYITSAFKQKYPISTTDYVLSDLGSTHIDGYQYKVYSGQVVIEKYIGSQKNITIPSEIDGKPVTEIESGAFANNVNIESIVVPSSINRIESGTIVFNDSQMKYITTGAFSGCPNLKKVVFESGSKLNVISECTCA